MNHDHDTPPAERSPERDQARFAAQELAHQCDEAYFAAHPDRCRYVRPALPFEDPAGDWRGGHAIVVEHVAAHHFRRIPLDGASVGWSRWDRRRRKGYVEEYYAKKGGTRKRTPRYAV